MEVAEKFHRHPAEIVATSRTQKSRALQRGFRKCMLLQCDCCCNHAWRLSACAALNAIQVSICSIACRNDRSEASTLCSAKKFWMSCFADSEQNEPVLRTTLAPLQV